MCYASRAKHPGEQGTEANLDDRGSCLVSSPPPSLTRNISSICFGFTHAVCRWSRSRSISSRRLLSTSPWCESQPRKICSRSHFFSATLRDQRRVTQNKRRCSRSSRCACAQMIGVIYVVGSCPASRRSLWIGVLGRQGIPRPLNSNGRYRGLGLTR